MASMIGHAERILSWSSQPLICFTNRDETLARDGACCTQAASDAGDGSFLVLQLASFANQCGVEQMHARALPAGRYTRMRNGCPPGCCQQLIGLTVATRRWPRGCACDTQMGTILRLLYFSDFAIFIISSLDSLELSIST